MDRESGRYRTAQTCRTFCILCVVFVLHVIDPLVYGYVQGKKVPSVRYWRVRNLTPSEVSSLIARGYEVSVVDQETPLTPPTVYASSIIERSKILHPDISHAAQTQRPEYKMSWIEKVGDIGRRRHAGRRSPCLLYTSPSPRDS